MVAPTVLVDTSVWVAHLRSTDARLVEVLDRGDVVMHPMVIGELACGNLPKRADMLHLFHLLPTSPVASDAEVLDFIDANRLMGRGIGWVDVHLLASARLGAEVRLWTLDTRLATAARRLFVAYGE